MVGQQPIKGAFDKRAEVDFQRRFTSPETRTAARAVQGRAENLIEKAKAYRDERLKNIVKQAQEKPQPRLTPRFIGRLFGQAGASQRQGFRSEQARLQRRSDRILKARDNELQRIEDRHEPAPAKAGDGRQQPAEHKAERAENSPVVEAGYLAGQFAALDEQEAAHEPEPAHEPAPAEAVEQDFVQEPEPAPAQAVEWTESTPSWTPEEREAAINAEREAQAESDLGYDYDPGRVI